MVIFLLLVTVVLGDESATCAVCDSVVSVMLVGVRVTANVVGGAAVGRFVCAVCVAVHLFTVGAVCCCGKCCYLLCCYLFL